MSSRPTRFRDFDVSVYNGSIYNSYKKEYERIDFIYIGFIGFHNTRKNVILTNIDDCPEVRIVYRSDIAQYIFAGKVYAISVQHMLNLMNKVNSIPSAALDTWNNSYNVYLEQWAENKYYNINCTKIQKAWLNAFYNPSFTVCQNRLKKEFENLIENA